MGDATRAENQTALKLVRSNSGSLMPWQWAEVQITA
jgi:hypothetical protein